MTDVIKADTEVMPNNEIVTNKGLQPVMTIEETGERHRVITEYVKKRLVDGKDFGTIPNCGNKPCLFKQGAEKITTLFGLSKKFYLLDCKENPTGEGIENNEPYYSYRYKCELWQGNNFIADSEGSCNSWEKKYRYRKGELNKDIHDQVNTIQKMAQKRAFVAVVLCGVGASDFFTQDIEDMPNKPNQQAERPRRQPPQQTRQAPPQRQAPTREQISQAQPQQTKTSNNSEIALIVENRNFGIGNTAEENIVTVIEQSILANNKDQFFETLFTNPKDGKCYVYSTDDFLNNVDMALDKGWGLTWLPTKATNAIKYINEQRQHSDPPHQEEIFQDPIPNTFPENDNIPY